MITSIVESAAFFGIGRRLVFEYDIGVARLVLTTNCVVGRKWILDVIGAFVTA